MKNIKKKAIVCFGEVLWDMLPAGAQPGGAPMNVAIHLKRQGIDPVLVSRVGNDADGQKLRQFLLDSGLDLTFLQADKSLPTSRVLVHLDSVRNATYEICEPVAWDNIQFATELEHLAAETGLIVFGTLALRNEKTRNTLLKFFEHSPARRFLDVNLRPPFDRKEVVEKALHLADYAKLNNEELETVAGWNSRKGNEEVLARWFAEFFSCSTVCVTRGANGAAILKGDKWFEHPGFKVVAADTVGAGDSFLAGLIARLSSGGSAGEALEYACATGSFVASRHGAVPEYSPQDIQWLTG